MAWRLYIVPVIGTGASRDPRRPKYFADGSVSGNWSSIEYGFEPWAIVGADLSPVDDAFVVAQADGLALPVDLSRLLSVGQVSAVQAKLDAINVPSAWVNTSLTWADVVRTVLGIFLFLQRFVAVRGNGLRTFAGGVTLDTRINQLPAAVQSDLQTAASSLELSTAGIIGTTTIRGMLKALADQFQAKTMQLGGVII